MIQINYFTDTIISLLLTFIAITSFAAPSPYSQTRGKQSPAQNCLSQSNCTVIYSSPDNRFTKERIGKKLAIRSIYLIPIDPISKRFCKLQNTGCKDTYEVAFFYLELQSIWPEPVLLTAARVRVKSKSSAIHMDAGMFGSTVLAKQITSNQNPSEFLFKPGEIKFIVLSQGIKLDGILDFFKGDVLKDDIWTDQTPISIPYVGRVVHFNRFLQSHFGKATTIQIQLFEKDYQPILTTDVKLGEGGDFFAQGDISTSKYQFKHDAFIGEVLYQLNGGTESFVSRRENGEKKSNATGTASQPNSKTPKPISQPLE